MRSFITCTRHQKKSNEEAKENEMGRACSAHGERMSACKILVRKSERKIPLGRHKRRWKNNIKMELKEIGWGDVD
jgi:hypothetical protein